MVEGADQDNRRKEQFVSPKEKARTENVLKSDERSMIDQRSTESKHTQRKGAPGNEIPPGWDYNPAAWSQRIPIITLAMIGFIAAGYLALYQFRIIDSVWDPFFGNGSVVILNSPISNVLPIPDGALGALSYLVDAVAGVIGSQRRWKTMPWMVVLFGIAVGPLGFVSVMLVIFQPVLFSAWCSICIFTAIISVVMIGPSMDEVLASLQYLRRVKNSGRSLWGGFWGYSDIIENVK